MMVARRKLFFLRTPRKKKFKKSMHIIAFKLKASLEGKNLFPETANSFSQREQILSFKSTPLVKKQNISC